MILFTYTGWRVLHTSMHLSSSHSSQTIVNGGDFMKKWLICFQLVFLFTLAITPIASAAKCPTVKPCVIDI